MELPDRLKILRGSLGLSQKALASELGIAVRSWQVYEEGKSVPGGEVFAALTRKGFDANWLLTGEGEMRRGEGGLGGAQAQTQNQSISEIDRGGDPPSSSADGPTGDNDKANIYNYFKDDRSNDVPSMNEVCSLLRLIIEMYDQFRPDAGPGRRCREIPLIFRYFVDNYRKGDDEVEICDYIKEWF